MGLRPALAVLALLVAWNPPSWGESPQSFQASKRLLAGIHEDIEHQLSLYCGCPYERKGRSGGDIDRQTCGLSARKNEKRSDRIEWEHVEPASWIGERHACWSEGHARFRSFSQTMSARRARIPGLSTVGTRSAIAAHCLL